MRVDNLRGARIAAAAAVVAVVGACSRTAPPVAAAPAVDSAAVRARADSLALAAAQRNAAEAAARRDAAAAAARSDSLTRAAAVRARADSVHAQVLRDGDDRAPAATGVLSLDAAAAETLARPVLFAFDRFDLTAEAVALLDQALTVLRGHPTLVVVIEGHCDDRGSDEYNLALGNRRAAAVKRYLVEHGLAEERLSIVSYGEERPVDPARNEAAWARNRRAEFRVSAGT